MLESILGHIDRVYDLGLDVDIHEFLLTREMCDRLGHDAARASVLVRDAREDGELELGLYLQESALEELGRIDLGAEIPAGSFEALVTAIEEVSHFAYLLYSASKSRTVTQLELELQGEVDKFITAMLLLASSNGGRVPKNLLDRMFGDFVIRSGLDEKSRARYRDAASLASRYCSYLARSAHEDERLGRLLPELRRFYRLGQRGKIGRIHRVVYSA